MMSATVISNTVDPKTIIHEVTSRKRKLGSPAGKTSAGRLMGAEYDTLHIISANDFALQC